MAYYFFNRCPKKVFPKIEALVQELGLIEIEALEGYRLWAGNILNRPKDFDKKFTVRYSEKKDPLMLETSGRVSHKQKDVKVLVRQFIDICKPTEIRDCFNPYDLREFE